MILTKKYVGYQVSYTPERLEFSLKEKFLDKQEFEQAAALADEIAKMLWGMLRKM